MNEANNDITFFGETNFRNQKVRFGIRADDRRKHLYIIGKTGMGKTELLKNLIIQDINAGRGLAFVDPHGDPAEELLNYIPENRVKDIIYFNPADLAHPIAFNVMEEVNPEFRHLIASGLMGVFKKIWPDVWSARMEYILNNTILALLEYPNSTLLGINRMLADSSYRKKVVDNIKDPMVKAFWTQEFARYTDRLAVEATAAIQNKVGQFISNPLIRNVIGQPRSTFDLRKMMDERKIIIMNLSKGRVGEINANLLGSMLVTKVYLAAMSRADAPQHVMSKLPNFYLYVDEFQSFANESFADVLSEARKYKLNLTVAHQYIEQMSEEVRAAVFGNVGTMIIFRVGAYDAEVLEKEFAPQFTAEDLVNLGFAQVYLKLMIDGVTSPPFSATTLPPLEHPKVSLKENIIQFSRQAFARPKADVERAIIDWSQAYRLPPPPPRRSEERKYKWAEGQGPSQPLPPASERSSGRVFSKPPPRRSPSPDRYSARSERWSDGSERRSMPLKELGRVSQKGSGENFERNRAELRNALTSLIAGGGTGAGKVSHGVLGKSGEVSLEKKLTAEDTSAVSFSGAKKITRPPGGNGRKGSGGGKAEAPPADNFSREKPKEVPEEVLRKILSIEK